MKTARQRKAAGPPPAPPQDLNLDNLKNHLTSGSSVCQVPHESSTEDGESFDPFAFLSEEEVDIEREAIDVAVAEAFALENLKLASCGKLGASAWDAEGRWWKGRKHHCHLYWRCPEDLQRRVQKYEDRIRTATSEREVWLVPLAQARDAGLLEQLGKPDYLKFPTTDVPREKFALIKAGLIANESDGGWLFYAADAVSKPIGRRVFGTYDLSPETWEEVVMTPPGRRLSGGLGRTDDDETGSGKDVVEVQTVEVSHQGADRDVVAKCREESLQAMFDTRPTTVEEMETEALMVGEALVNAYHRRGVEAKLRFITQALVAWGDLVHATNFSGPPEGRRRP